MTGRIVRLVTALLLTLAVILGQGALAEQVCAVLPEAVLLEQPAGFLLPAQKLEEVSGGVALSEAATVTLETGVGVRQPVLLQAVGGGYGEITGLKLVRGTDLSTPGTVIISQKLATELYLSLDVLGAAVCLDGKTYTIGGVYRQEEGLLAQLSRGPQETIYRRIDSRETATGLLMTGAGEGTDQMLQRLNQQAQRKIPVARVTDYRAWRSFARYLTRLTGYWLALAGGAVLVVLMVLAGKKALGFWQEKKRVTAPVSIAAGIAAALALGAVLLVGLTGPGLELPLVLLPEENPFALGHYLQWIVATVQEQNGGAVLLWNAVLPRQLSWQGILLLAGIPLAALTAWRAGHLVAVLSKRD